MLLSNTDAIRPYPHLLGLVEHPDGGEDPGAGGGEDLGVGEGHPLLHQGPVLLAVPAPQLLRGQVVGDRVGLEQAEALVVLERRDLLFPAKRNQFN